MRKSIFIILSGLSLAAGCGRSDKEAVAADSEFVAQYRDSILLMQDILKQIPADISKEDSASLIKTITDQWIDGLLIEDLAGSQIDDMDRINSLTQMYRRSLIADSYRRKMRQNGVQPIDKKKASQYYKSHISEMKLERPIIKGLFIRLPSTSRHIDEVRGWMKSDDPESYDQLENTGRREATVFRYFADRWIDFDVIADEIPKNLSEADKFVEETTDFETEINGTVYILHLTDHRKSGETMPEEYAIPLIEDRMSTQNLADYEIGLIKALRKSAIENNILKEGNYLKEK
ncbi:MAG: hypothetical protein K2G85_04690 [Muribaculaceae bacterium]|nr:hypothetical protein [Muribaculaceae bacterium]